MVKPIKFEQQIFFLCQNKQKIVELLFCVSNVSDEFLIIY